MGQAVTETERLIVTEASVEDCEFFYDLMNSENWLKHIGDRGINNYSDAEEYIQKSLIDSYRGNGFGLYKVSLKETDEPIGINGFVKRTYLEFPDIGFATLPEHEGNGYTFEVANKLLSYGEEQLGLPTIMGITTDENKASQHLLTKIGLTFQRKLRSSLDDDELLVYST